MQPRAACMSLKALPGAAPLNQLHCQLSWGARECGQGRPSTFISNAYRLVPGNGVPGELLSRDTVFQINMEQKDVRPPDAPSRDTNAPSLQLGRAGRGHTASSVKCSTGVCPGGFPFQQPEGRCPRMAAKGGGI